MFWLCHIGHDEDECPDEGLVGGGIRFGKALRCLPQKKDAGRRRTIPADDQGARRGLNFSGDQRHRAMSAASSSAGQKQRSNQYKNKRRLGEDGQVAGGAIPGGHKGIPVAI